MNKSTISIEFGEHIEAVTADTQYVVDVDSDSDMDVLDGRIKAVMYSVWMDAQAQRLAKYLEKKKAAYFNDLYVFTYGVAVLSEDVYRPPTKTESIVLKIIDEKAAYEKRIESTWKQYDRFQSVCRRLSEDDQELFIAFFERRLKLSYERIREVIYKNLSLLERVYEAVNKEKEKSAIYSMRGCTTSEAAAYHAQHEGKQQYFVHGQFKYMTEAEYVAYQEKQNEKRAELISNVFERHKPGELLIFKSVAE